MITYNKAIEIIQESCDSLHRGGLINAKIIINEETHILGGKSVFDSIGFITLFSEIEEKIEEKTDFEVFLVLDEINEFDIDSPFLSAGIIASYIVELTKENN
jgi:hypothetical protein